MAGQLAGYRWIGWAVVGFSRSSEAASTVRQTHGGQGSSQAVATSEKSFPLNHSTTVSCVAQGEARIPLLRVLRLFAAVRIL